MVGCVSTICVPTYTVVECAVFLFVIIFLNFFLIKDVMTRMSLGDHLRCFCFAETRHILTFSV